MRLALLVALALAGCTSSAPTDPHASTPSPTTPSATLSGADCTGTQTTLLGIRGVAGFNATWEPDRIRAELDRAGYQLRGAEFGVDGQDPFGQNFSFVQSGTPKERYQVEFLNGSRPHDAAIEPAARAQWAAARPSFNDSLFAFEGATGEGHVDVPGFESIVVTADYVCT